MFNKGKYIYFTLLSCDVAEDKENEYPPEIHSFHYYPARQPMKVKRTRCYKTLILKTSAFESLYGDQVSRGF